MMIAKKKDDVFHKCVLFTIRQILACASLLALIALAYISHHSYFALSSVTLHVTLLFKRCSLLSYTQREEKEEAEKMIVKSLIFHTFAPCITIK